MRCNKIVKTPYGEKPCYREEHINGKCSADLLGVKISGYTVTRKGPDAVYKAGKGKTSHHTRWVLTDDITGDTRLIHAQGLLDSGGEGRCRFITKPKGHKYSCQGSDGRIRPEYRTVESHWKFIFRSRRIAHANYKGMPFFDGWNPLKGGSHLTGMRWIIDNLGERPDGCSMHIVKHELGFVPGNLQWSYPQKQCQEQMFKIIANQRVRIKELEEEIERLRSKTIVT